MNLKKKQIAHKEYHCTFLIWGSNVGSIKPWAWDATTKMMQTTTTWGIDNNLV